MISPINDTQASVMLDITGAGEVAFDLLQRLNDADVDVSVGVAALLMCIMRLLAVGKITEEETTHFLQSSLEWLGTYFAEGGSN